MSLSRKMLKAMGIEDEKIDQIIEAHTEVVDAIKTERDSFKQDAEKFPTIQKELEELKAKKSVNQDDEFKLKYEKVKKDFDDFKNDVVAKQTKAEKSAAYKALLKSVGVYNDKNVEKSESLLNSIVNVTNLDDIEIVDGKIKDSDKIAESAKEHWGDFIVTSQTTGANVANPPFKNNGDMTKEAFTKLPLNKQMEYANEHPNETHEFLKE